MPSIYLGCPTTRDFSAQYVKSLWTSRFPGPMWWEPVIGQAVDLARNLIVEKFLKTNFDFLLMHDSDATWHPEAVKRLVSRNLPVVTGVIFLRKIPTIPTIGKYAGVDVEGHHLYSFADTCNRISERLDREGLTGDFDNVQLFGESRDDLQEVDGYGAHFCLIRRDVLEAIKFPYYQCSSLNGGEDFYFCRQVQAAGFKSYVDYSVFTGHVAGPGIEFGAREFIAFRDKTKLQTIWTV